MNPNNIETSVCLHSRRQTGCIAEVQIFDCSYVPGTRIPSGVIFCEVECIPEVIKALRQALKIAKKEGRFDATSDEGADA
jgi:hypothetical protein